MKKFKVAVIGTGFIGLAHVEALRRLGYVDVVAICDSVNAEQKAKEMHIDRYYHDHKEMLAKEELDVVHICTPNNTHYPIAIDAMHAGVNVYCEKPMCLNMQEADDMIRIEKETNTRGGVNFHNRFYPMAVEMRSRVATGITGEIFSVHGGYIQDWMCKRTDYTWKLHNDITGESRTVADIGTHWVDLAEHITGLKVTEVMADYKKVYETRLKPDQEVETFSENTSEVTYSEIPVENEDHANLMMRFENGAVGSAVISQTIHGRKNKTDMFVSGTDESLHWCSDTVNDLFIGHRDGHNEFGTKSCGMSSESLAMSTYPGGHGEGFPDAFKHTFNDYYQSLMKPEAKFNFATFEDGRHIVNVLSAFNTSSKTRQWVKLEK